MVQIGLLSDTHSYFPKQINAHFQDVDEIWHAGDIGNLAVANELENLKPLRAVYGNIDGADLRVRYPAFLYFIIEQVSVLITHIGGYPNKYQPEALKLIQQYKPHLMICGHSHILKVMPDLKYNLLHLNPGACGKQGWHKVNTMLKFNIELDRVTNLQVIEWDRKE